MRPMIRYRVCNLAHRPRPNDEPAVEVEDNIEDIIDSLTEQGRLATYDAGVCLFWALTSR